MSSDLFMASKELLMAEKLLGRRGGYGKSDVLRSIVRKNGEFSQRRRKASIQRRIRLVQHRTNAFHDFEQRFDCLGTQHLDARVSEIRNSLEEWSGR